MNDYDVEYSDDKGKAKFLIKFFILNPSSNIVI